MNQTRTLHLLNGQEMLNYFKETHFLEGEWMIPFNEAMCYGNTCSDIFSHEFTQIRAEVHHVTVEQYNEITLKPLKALLGKDFTHISLWFDADMFCQINVLTILAWLDQINYKGSIDLCIVDDKFNLQERFALKAEGYHAIYNQVLIQKSYPQNISPAPLKVGVELYLSYLNKDSDLINFIKKHQELSEEKLVQKLLKEFKYYGLGDTQYSEIIRYNRAN